MTTLPAQREKASSRMRMPQFLRGIRGVHGLPREIIAGVTLAALMIPLNIGYAQVAGLPPILGLYAAIYPMIAFAIFATSRNLIASPDAPIAALIGGVLLSVVAADNPLFVQHAYALALLCALIFFLFWFFRLGFLANFLSHAVLVGFISGLGIEVFTSQLKKIMGVSIEAEGYFRELFALVASIPAANWYSVAIGVGTIVIIRLLKRYVPKLPGALLALIVMTAIVAIFNLDQEGVSVLGPVPSGLPTLTFPQVPLSSYVKLLPGALAVCGVTLAEGLLIAKKYAQKYDYKIDPDQEMFAFGAANAVAGLTGSFIIGSSASRTAAMDGAGARSQIPSIVAAVAVAILLLFFAPLLALLPNAALGGIVANAVLSLIEVGELRELYRMRRSEFWIAIVCLLSVLVLGALLAVIIAFVLSTIAIVGRASRPQTSILREDPEGSGFYPEVDDDANAVTAPTAPAVEGPLDTLPGLIIYRFSSSLYFANAGFFSDQVEQLVDAAAARGEKLKWFVLDASAINDVDTTGAQAIEQVIDLLERRQITFAISHPNPRLPILLMTYELIDKIGADHLYLTNRKAVEAFGAATADAANADAANAVETE